MSANFDFFFRFRVRVFFFTGSANDLLSLTSTAYNKRTNPLNKNLRHVLRSECDLNWLLPFIFGWPGLKFTVTPTFTKSFSFLNRVNILIFFKGISNNLELLSFQKMYGFWGFLLKAKALEPINAERVLEGGSEGG